MDNGWVKVHRKMLDNPVVWKDPDHLAVWMYLLLSASHREYETLFGGKPVKLKPGQLITGRRKISSETQVEHHKVERILKLFKSAHQIEQQSKPYGSLISICRWDEYQNNEHQNEQRMSNERATSEQRVSTKQEYKEQKNGKNKYIYYGEFENVALTDDEYTKLVDRFPMDYQDRIENLSAYLKQTGRRYKSHYATILAWDRKNKKDAPKKGRLDWIDDIQ